MEWCTCMLDFGLTSATKTDSFYWNIFITVLCFLPYLQLFLLLSFWLERVRWDTSARIPGPSSIPVIGDSYLMSLTSTPFPKLIHFRQIYGSTLRVWFGRKVFVLVTDVDVIEKIYSKYNVRNRAENVANPIKQIILQGLLVSKNENWRRSRKIVVSTLHKHSLNLAVENFAKNSNILLKRLLETEMDTSVDIRRYFTQFAIDVFFETMLGMEENAQFNNDWQLIQNIWKCFSITNIRNWKPWLYMDSIFKMTPLGKEYQHALEKVHVKLRDIIRKRQKVIQRNIEVDENDVISKGEYAKCLDLLLTKDCKSEDEVLGECINLFAAGVSTVALTCSYVFVFLAENPQIQDKVVQEQLNIFGKEDFKRPVTAEDLPQMTYLEQVIKETLRLCPAIPYIFRQHDQDMDIGSGMTIPANTSIVVCNYLVHRDAKHFPDPLKFNPDNFAPDLDRRRHPYSYSPFGGGRRICICQNMAMMEIKSAVSTLLRHLRVTATINTMRDLEKRFVLSIDLRSSLEILVKLSPRDYFCEETVLWLNSASVHMPR